MKFLNGRLYKSLGTATINVWIRVIKGLSTKIFWFSQMNSWNSHMIIEIIIQNNSLHGLLWEQILTSQF